MQSSFSSEAKTPLMEAWRIPRMGPRSHQHRFLLIFEGMLSKHFISWAKSLPSLVAINRQYGARRPKLSVKERASRIPKLRSLMAQNGGDRGLDRCAECWWEPKLVGFDGPSVLRIPSVGKPHLKSTDSTRQSIVFIVGKCEAQFQSWKMQAYFF